MEEIYLYFTSIVNNISTPYMWKSHLSLLNKIGYLPLLLITLKINYLMKIKKK